MPLTYRRFAMLALLALLATFAPVARPALALSRIVTNTNDSGAGSLRQAMLDAQPGDIITFNNGAATWTIALTQAGGPLPPLDNGNVTIDGGAGHRVVLDGSAIDSGDGFLITSSNNTIKGLVIINFPNGDGIYGWSGAGIHIVGTDINKSDKPIVTGNKILGNWIGVAADGVTAAPNDDFGVLIDSRSSGNIIGGTTAADRNVISGNGSRTGDANVAIYRALAPTSDAPITNNEVIGNYIGTRADGLGVIGGVGNRGRGLVLAEWAQNNIVGGTLAGEGNVIAGHNIKTPTEATYGIVVTGATNRPNSGNVIAGNYIGVGANGSTAIPNNVGVQVTGTATTNTTLGGPTAASRNVISGNSTTAVLVENPGVTSTTIANNWIGLTAAGGVLGNGAVGVRVGNGAITTTIGPGNVIAATTNNYGVHISTNNNVLKGNFIGTNSTGTLSNATFTTNQASVLIDGGTGNRIGGTTAADRNVIALSDDGTAILLRSPSSSTTVQGSYIGVAASGTAPLNGAPPEASNGILIEGGSSNNIIGGAAAGAGNIIGGTGNGIQIKDSGSNNNQVKGNAIGAGTGSANVGNASYGVWLLSGPTGNQIGGTAAGEGNTIAYNGFVGVSVQSASNNTIAGNSVRNNGNYGIEISQSTGVRISQTETTSNVFGDGIRLTANGNNLLAAPTNLGFGLVGNVPRLTGNACANCTIEIFVSPNVEDGEGPRYLTTVVADSNGAFSADVTGCDPHFTATARNAANDTSPFTKPMLNPPAGSCATPEPAIQLGAGTPVSTSGAPHLTNPGTSVVYSHLLTNVGTASGNFTLGRTTSQGWASAPSVTSVTLAPGQSQTIQVTVVVPAGAAPGTTDQTTLTASVTGQPSASQSDYTRVRQVAGVVLGPAAGRSGQVTPGNFIDYTHYITNTGNGIDSFTLSATHTAPSATVSFPDGATCANLAVGAGCTRRVRVSVAAGSTDILDTATLTATSQFNSAVSDSVSDITQITQVPVPQISAGTTKNASPPAVSVVEFVHTVRNVGGASGQFTASVTPSPSRPGWTFAVTPATPFTLAPNATRTVTLTVTVAANAAVGEDVTAQVKVLASSGAQVTTNDIVHILLVPNLSFSPAAVSPVSGQPGELVNFTHTLTNNGNGADSFTIVLTSTAGLTNLSRTPAGQINLAKGQSVQVTVSARIANGAPAGAQTIGATAQRLSAPLQASTRVDTVNVVGAAVPQLTAAQPQTTTLPLPSTRVFTHTLTNIGNQAGTFTLGAVAPPGWTATPSSPACLTGLVQGGTCQFTVQVNVPAGALAGAHRIVVTATASSSASVTDTLNVPPDPDLVFTPDYNGTADPGEVFTYTHTLTNTGNITDSFEIELLVDSGWSALARPAVVDSVPPGATRSVAIVVTAPEGVLAGSTGTVTATAQSAFAPFPSQSVVDRTTINAKPGARLIPSQQTLSANPTQTLSDTATFIHILRNSGSIPLTYTLAVDAPPTGWTATISPTQVGPLDPGAEATVELAITVPANTPFGEVFTSTLQVQQFGGPAASLAIALDTTVVGPQFGAMLTPSRNDQQVLPGATATYTHTLRNTGAHADTFLISAIAPNGWDTNVTPPSINLARNASSTITVTVRAPTSALSGTLDIATVQAQSVTDSSAAPGTAQEYTTVLHVAGVSLSPPRYRTALPGRTLVFQHTLVNTGNGLDTFTLAATISGTGVLTWPVTIDPLSIRLIQGDTYPVVQVRVEVPASAARNASGRVIVTATSRSDPTVQDQLVDQIRGPDLVSGLPWTIYLPTIAR